jgi:outer membrane lipoprotein SlyB
MTERNVFVKRGAIVFGALLLGACVVLPTGPSVMVLPGSGHNMESFRSDDMYCREYAHIQIGGKTATDAAKESVVTSAAVGTVVGAVAGAAIGGSGRGAATGAGVGLLMGSAVGSDAGRASGIGTQRQYDNAYIQCMYSKGHRVPVPAGMVSSPTSSSRAMRAPDAGIPPPPPGSPPPPPPNR